MSIDTAPNHHRDHPGFAGLSGLLAALTFSVGRGHDADLAARLTDLGDGDTVVDVGCGPGVAARRAASHGATVIGIDPADVMLRTARLFPHRRGVRYLSGVAEALPVEDGVATIAWSLSTVHHWADVDAGLDELHRILRPDGRFVALERLTRADARGIASHGWTVPQAEAFAERCRAHGFTGVEVQRHPGRRALISVVARRE
jgi:ubiquinone/menaquinone biosynthesis C-methylase UbiE